MKRFEVSTAGGHVYGVYEADTEQHARDLCTRDAGYRSEADMERQLETKSHLIALEIAPLPKGLRI